VEVHDYPGFEVKALSRASADETVQLLQQRGMKLKEGGATKIMPSLAHDLIAGGCFRCVELGFDKLEGVIETAVAYRKPIILAIFS
jgi:hypothetical protein